MLKNSEIIRLVTFIYMPITYVFGDLVVNPKTRLEMVSSETLEALIRALRVGRSDFSTRIKGEEVMGK
jgi:hypothetical protein